VYSRRRHLAPAVSVLSGLHVRPGRRLHAVAVHEGTSALCADRIHYIAKLQIAASKHHDYGRHTSADVGASLYAAGGGFQPMHDHDMCRIPNPASCGGAQDRTEPEEQKPEAVYYRGERPSGFLSRCAVCPQCTHDLVTFSQPIMTPPLFTQPGMNDAVCRGNFGCHGIFMQRICW